VNGNVVTGSSCIASVVYYFCCPVITSFFVWNGAASICILVHDDTRPIPLTGFAEFWALKAPDASIGQTEFLVASIGLAIALVSGTIETGTDTSGGIHRKLVGFDGRIRLLGIFPAMFAGFRALLGPDAPVGQAKFLTASIGFAITLVDAHVVTPATSSRFFFSLRLLFRSSVGGSGLCRRSFDRFLGGDRKNCRVLGGKVSGRLG